MQYGKKQKLKKRYRKSQSQTKKGKSTKGLTKNFITKSGYSKKDGFVVIPNFLDKSKLNKIFSQLNELIDVPINSINTKIRRKLTLDEKYLFLQKKNPKLKSHFYDTIRFIDSINEISSYAIHIF